MDPLAPDASTLIALGSALVHAQELLSPTGAPEDKAAFDSVMSQPNVQEWLAAMAKMAFLPVKR